MRGGVLEHRRWHGLQAFSNLSKYSFWGHCWAIWNLITKGNKETTERTAWKDKQNLSKNSPASGMTAATTSNNFEEIEEAHIDGSVFIGMPLCTAARDLNTNSNSRFVVWGLGGVRDGVSISRARRTWNRNCLFIVTVSQPGDSCKM